MANVNESPSSSGQKSSRQGSVAGQSNSGQQGLTEKSQRGGLSRSGVTAPYFPSAADLFANPFAAMRRIHEDMDRMFAQALGTGGGTRASSGSDLAMWSPAIETKQRGNDLVVCAELPGLKPEEVQVEVNEDALVIQGERRQEQSSEEGGVRHTERRYGRFYRAIPLPDGVNAEQANASFKDGVLEVTIPLPQQKSRARQIPITGASSGSGTPNGGGSSQNPSERSSGGI